MLYEFNYGLSKLSILVHNHYLFKHSFELSSIPSSRVSSVSTTHEGLEGRLASLNSSEEPLCIA